MFNHLPDVLTIPQLAAALGVGENTAYRMVHTREIGSKRIGRRILVPKICLEDYIKSARYTVSQGNSGFPDALEKE